MAQSSDHVQSAKLSYVVVLGLLTTLGPFTIDLYVPAFPQIMSFFQVSEGYVQMTLAGTTFGFALGHLVVGIWSDQVGRRYPLLLATALHVLASVGCSLSQDIYTLWALRFVQGLGAAASSVVVKAIIRDQFEGRPLAIMLSRVGFVTTATPILAPILGVELMLLTGWRGIFWVLAGFAALLLFLTWYLVAETYPREIRSADNRRVLKRVSALFRDPLFIGATLTGGMVFAAVYIYVAASSLLFQSVYEFSPRAFSLIFLVMTLGLALGIRLNARLAKKWAVHHLLLGATSVMALSSISIIVTFGLHSATPVLLALWIMMLATGVAFPNASTLSLLKHKTQAGTAASLYGAFSFTVSAILSPVPGFMGFDTAVPTGIVLSVVSCIGVLGAGLIVLYVSSTPLKQEDGLQSPMA